MFYKCDEILGSILAAREKRWNYRSFLVDKYHRPVVTITINIPSTNKTKDSYVKAYNCIVKDFEKIMTANNLTIIYKEARISHDGPELFMVIKAHKALLKRLCIQFEESHLLGRLADIDVMDEENNILTRRNIGLKERKCLLCDNNAIACIVSKNHPLKELLIEIDKIIESYLSMQSLTNHDKAMKISNLAIKALLYEVCASPKPGLVDRGNSGAHVDMNIFTFINSSISLIPTFYSCTMTGLENPEKSPQDVFKRIRNIGIQGEKQMYHSTKGVNTQKGLIFSLGTLCAAAGQIVSKNEKIAVNRISHIVAEMTTGIIEKELESLNGQEINPIQLTAGQRLYLKYGVTGIRGEAQQGFSTVVKHGVPYLKNCLSERLTMNDAMVNTLLYIMTMAEDTNVLWRSDKDGLQYVKSKAKNALELGGMKTPEGHKAIQLMDKDLIKKNISPGGSADLLAITLMFYWLVTEL